ncbi:MAG: hypothetical protein WCJ67_09925 [Thermoleophilia bacterium]
MARLDASTMIGASQDEVVARFCDANGRATWLCDTGVGSEIEDGPAGDQQGHWTDFVGPRVVQGGFDALRVCVA